MNSLIILRHKLTVFGGAELILLKEAEYFAKHGYDVTVVVFEINYEVFKNRIKSLDLIVLDKKGFFGQVYALRKLIKKIRPQAIIAHENGHIHFLLSKLFLLKKPFSLIHMYGSFVWLVGSKLNNSFFYRRVIKNIHSTLPGHKIFNKDFDKKLDFFKRLKSEVHAIIDFFAVRSFDKILTCSKRTAWEIEKLYNKAPLIIPGGVDTDFFNPEKENINEIKSKFGYSIDDRIIMTINRLDPRKRIDLLIKSFLIAVKKIKNLKLVIIGSGPEEKKLRRLINSIHGKDIFLLGFMDDAELRQYYLISEIITYPAWCAWGLVPLEALSMNKKIVLSDDAMVQEAISDFDNVFVSRPSVEDFGINLIKALNSPFKESRERVIKEFNWPVYFNKIHKTIINYNGVDKDRQ